MNKDTNPDFKVKSLPATFDDLPWSDTLDRSRPVRLHSLKAWPVYFNEVLRGEKNHELRRDDRDFRAGDRILLNEWVPDKVRIAPRGYTGRVVRGTITRVTRPADLAEVSPGALGDGYAILDVSWELA